MCFEILGFAIIGVIAGWLAGNMTKGEGFGFTGNLAVGVIGAAVGGLLFQFIGIHAYSGCGELVTATIGAVVFLFLLQQFKHKI